MKNALLFSLLSFCGFGYCTEKNEIIFCVHWEALNLSSKMVIAKWHAYRSNVSFFEFMNE